MTEKQWLEAASSPAGRLAVALEFECPLHLPWWKHICHHRHFRSPQGGRVCCFSDGREIPEDWLMTEAQAALVALAADRPVPRTGEGWEGRRMEEGG